MKSTSYDCNAHNAMFNINTYWTWTVRLRVLDSVGAWIPKLKCTYTYDLNLSFAC